MKRINVTNVLGASFQADFEDPDQWIAEQVSNNSWGFPERWVDEDQCSESDRASALGTQIVIIFPEQKDDEGNVIAPAVTKTQCRLPSQYTVTITDATSEYNQQTLDAYTAQKIADADAQVQVILGGITDRRAMMEAIYTLGVILNPLGNFQQADINKAKSDFQKFLGIMSQVTTLFAQRDADIAAKKAELGL